LYDSGKTGQVFNAHTERPVLGENNLRSGL